MDRISSGSLEAATASMMPGSWIRSMTRVMVSSCPWLESMAIMKTT